MPELDDQIAVVTGAGSGIGQGIALVLAQRGADIVVSDIDIAAAEAVADEVRSFGKNALAVQSDVTDRESTDALASTVITDLGRIDILVNNAGVGGAPGWWQRSSPSPEDWEATYDVNVIGIVNTTSSFQDHSLGASIRPDHQHCFWSGATRDRRIRPLLGLEGRCDQRQPGLCAQTGGVQHQRELHMSGAAVDPVVGEDSRARSDQIRGDRVNRTTGV